MDRQLLQQLENRHPAFEIPFDKAYKAIQERTASGLVSCRSDDSGLEIFCYTNQCSIKKKWDIYTLICRGLILDPQDKRVVATAFPKFFNYGEVRYIPNEPFVVSEKLDGSLGILFCHNNKWKIATKGSFESEQAQWASDYLAKHIDTSWLHPRSTYLVEIIYPENRIVINYPRHYCGLHLLSIYMQGYEIPHQRKAPYRSAERAGLETVKIRRFKTIDGILRKSKQLGSDEEGFVVRFQNGHRIKIKGKQYCELHRLISNCTPLAIWDLMRTGVDLDIARQKLPEEFQNDFDNITSLLRQKFNLLLGGLEKDLDFVAEMTDKELGLALEDGQYPLSNAGRMFLFAARKQDFLSKCLRPGRARDGLFRLMRPTNNKLEGYKPTTAMNRFGNDAN